jgi:putative transposase
MDTLVKFIAGHADQQVGGSRWGVEPICRVLSEHGCPIAPSTYYDALARSRRPSAQDVRDEVLKVEITRVHRDNYGIYGARKVWLQLNREGIRVARCTVERLMGVLGLAGARRGHPARKRMTTVNRAAVSARKSRESEKIIALGDLSAYPVVCTPTL